MSDGAPGATIIRRGKRSRHAYHGGSWKVAYADFVTAMMAFFLVMWLLGVATDEQKAAVSAYFNNPSMTQGTSTISPPGQMGPGGASDSAIQLGGAMDMSHGPGKDRHGTSKGQADVKESAKAAASSKADDQVMRKHDMARLEQLRDALRAAIEQSQALAPFKDQLLLDITPEGLRIQIVDKLNRPMFDLGSAQLKPYTLKILHELGSFINRVPNEISISGHTDNAPYSSGENDYSNWELSADRANAARRALLAGGLQSGKVTLVAGLAAAVPFDKVHPADPINRRISILVMTKEAQRAALSNGVANVGASGGNGASRHVPVAASPGSPPGGRTMVAEDTGFNAPSLSAPAPL